jgi:uncharacterized membrane protein YcaP (DUF421 family)
MLGHWLNQVFSHPSLFVTLTIVGKTVVIYVLVVAGLRLIGARELGEMSVYDFVLVVVIANAVQNALVGGDNSLVGGLASAFSLLAMNRALTWLFERFPALEHRVIGKPVVLIANGRASWRRLQREGIDRDELMAALRQHGVESINKVRLAMMEVDGEISVVPREGGVRGRPRRRFRGLRSQ